MKKNQETIEMIFAVISEEYPKLSKSEKSKLARVVFNFIQLLNDSKIKESANILYENYELVRIL